MNSISKLKAPMIVLWFVPTRERERDWLALVFSLLYKLTAYFAVAVKC